MHRHCKGIIWQSSVQPCAKPRWYPLIHRATTMCHSSNAQPQCKDEGKFVPHAASSRKDTQAWLRLKFHHARRHGRLRCRIAATASHCSLSHRTRPMAHPVRCAARSLGAECTAPPKTHPACDVLRLWCSAAAPKYLKWNVRSCSSAEF